MSGGQTPKSSRCASPGIAANGSSDWMVVVFRDASQLGRVDKDNDVSCVSLANGAISKILGICSTLKKRSFSSLARNSKDSSGKPAITSSSKLHSSPSNPRLLYLQNQTFALCTESGSVTCGNIREGSRINSRCTPDMPSFHFNALALPKVRFWPKAEVVRACLPGRLVSNFVVLRPTKLFIHSTSSMALPCHAHRVICAGHTD